MNNFQRLCVFTEFHWPMRSSSWPRRIRLSFTDATTRQFDSLPMLEVEDPTKYRIEETGREEMLVDRNLFLVGRSFV